VIARPAVTVQANRSPSRRGGGEVPGPTPVFRFWGANLTCAYKKRRATAGRFLKVSCLPPRLSGGEGVTRAISSAGRQTGQVFSGEVLQRALALHPDGASGLDARRRLLVDSCKNRLHEFW